MGAIDLRGSWALLASTELTADGPSSAAVTIPPMEMLQIQFNITGYSGSGIAAFRFNGDTTVGNYNTSYIAFSTAAPAAPTNTLGTLGMLRTGQNAVATQRSGIMTVYNYLGTRHGMTCHSMTMSTGATAPVTSIGSGNWNTAAAAQITTVQMLVDSSPNLLTGTSFAVFGMNP